MVRISSNVVYIYAKVRKAIVLSYAGWRGVLVVWLQYVHVHAHQTSLLGPSSELETQYSSPLTPTMQPKGARARPRSLAPPALQIDSTVLCHPASPLIIPLVVSIIRQQTRSCGIPRPVGEVKWGVPFLYSTVQYSNQQVSARRHFTHSLTRTLRPLIRPYSYGRLKG